MQPELFNRALIDACAPYLGKDVVRAASEAMPHAVEKSHTPEASKWVHSEGEAAGQKAPSAQ